MLASILRWSTSRSSAEEELEAGVDERRGLGAQDVEEADVGVSTTWLSLQVSRASLIGAGEAAGEGCSRVCGEVLVEGDVGGLFM
jgi:hypothetical protein